MACAREEQDAGGASGAAQQLWRVPHGRHTHVPAFPLSSPATLPDAVLPAPTSHYLSLLVRAVLAKGGARLGGSAVLFAGAAFALAQSNRATDSEGDGDLSSDRIPW